MSSKEVKQELILSPLDIGKGSSNQLSSFYEKGKDYVVRTVTMIYLGELKEEGENYLILTDCAWIPDTSRWNEFLKGEKPNEMEPYPNNVIVYKSGILDATEIKKKTKREII